MTERVWSWERAGGVTGWFLVLNGERVAEVILVVRLVLVIDW